MTPRERARLVGRLVPGRPEADAVERFLDEIAEVGYRLDRARPVRLPADRRRTCCARELAPAGPAASRRLRQVRPRGARAPGEAVEREAEDSCALLRGLGAEYLVIIDELYTNVATGADRCSRRRSTTPSGRGWSTTTARVDEVARRHGLRPVFHPHAQTHVEYESQIERLLADVDGLELCLDVGHHAYCGGEPVAFFRRHFDAAAFASKNLYNAALYLTRQAFIHEQRCRDLRRPRTDMKQPSHFGHSRPR